MDALIEKGNKIILFFLGYYIITVVFFKTLPYTLPFVLAILIALVLKKPTLFLAQRFKINTSISSLITTTIFFSVIISLLLLSITSLSSDIYKLTKTLSEYFSSNTDKPYALFDNIVAQIQKYYSNLDPYIINSIQDSLDSTMKTLASLTASIGGKIINFVINIASSIPYVFMVIIFTLITSYFFTKDLTVSKESFITSYFPKNSDKIKSVFSESKKMLVNYLTSYLIIILITFTVTLIGFLILGVKYPIVLSLLCAIFDLLPILGVAAIYIPLAIIYILSNNYFAGIGLLILYALVFVVRQVAEPRIVSSSLGLHPVSVLAAIFIGLKANGITGMFFCMFFVVFYNIFRKVNIL